MPVDDRHLIIDYTKNGSQAAFAELTGRYIKLVYATCFRELRNRELAEDATQVVFLLLARKAPALRHKGQLAGWMFHTSRLVSKNAARLERGRAIREQKNVELAMQTSEQSLVDWRPVDSCLNEALESLAGSEREVILMRFFEEMTLEETGASLQISEDAARMRVNRALEKLRRYLAKHGVSTSATLLAGLLTANSVAEASTARAAEIARIAYETGTGHITAGVVGVHAAQLLQGVQRTMLITKLAATTAVISVAAGGAFGAYPLITHSRSAKLATSVNLRPGLVKTIAEKPQPTDSELHALSAERLKQFAYGHIQYLQDHEEKAPNLEDPDATRKAILPYVKSPDDFIQPGADVPYKMNGTLANLHLAVIDSQETAVLFYDAVPDKDGNREVEYYDATSELVTAAKWAALNTAIQLAEPEAKRRAISESRLTDYAYGFKQHVLDHDNTLPDMHDLTALQNELRPYVKSTDDFIQPGASKPYQVNSTLSKLPLSQIAKPRFTVLFFETVTDNHGHRCVAFVDGRTELISSSVWAELKPKSPL